MKFKPLPRTLYKPSALVVAPKLLGHWLIHNTPEGPVGGPIVETEAYVKGDAACHAAPGLTPRNQVMFGPPGHAYVYFIYGCHFCVNAVCQPAGLAEAVLIRAVQAEFGLPFLRKRRGMDEPRSLTNGPGKLCQAMQIDRRLNDADLCGRNSELIIAENPEIEEFLKQNGPIVTTVRIGITKAAHLPLRFYLSRNVFVSRREKTLV